MMWLTPTVSGGGCASFGIGEQRPRWLNRRPTEKEAETSCFVCIF